MTESPDTRTDCYGAELGPISESDGALYVKASVEEVKPSADEEAFFEVYWAVRKQKSWERGLLPSESGKPCPKTWGDGFKQHAREAWMARAGLHVSRKL